MQTKTNRIMISKKAAFRAGVLGGLVMTAGMAVTRAVEITPLNYELSLGSLLTTTLDSFTWAIGFLFHLAISGCIGLIYRSGFQLVNRSNWLIGTAFGVAHWLISGVLMGLLPALYSVMPELMPSPGMFGRDFGPLTTYSNIVIHLLFGGIMGSMLKPRAQIAAGGARVPTEYEAERPKAAASASNEEKKAA